MFFKLYRRRLVKIVYNLILKFFQPNFDGQLYWKKNGSVLIQTKLGIRNSTMAVITVIALTLAVYLLPSVACSSNHTRWSRRASLQTPFPEVRMRHMRHSGLSATGEPLVWPLKKEAVVDGDLLLGGLMMVHSREDTQFTCGPIMAQGGIQTVETMLYTLDQINKEWTKFKIGALILDDCDKDTYGLEMAIDFIKGQF